MSSFTIKNQMGGIKQPKKKNNAARVLDPIYTWRTVTGVKLNNN